MSLPDFKLLPGMELEEDAPVFNEPWEASAFALVVGLHQNGTFEWSHWAETLGGVVKRDDGSTSYYELWLKALETIISEKSLIADGEIVKRKQEWQAALLATPHGQPIELKNAAK